jgi:hypothetical protein
MDFIIENVFEIPKTFSIMKTQKIFNHICLMKEATLKEIAEKN